MLRAKQCLKRQAGDIELLCSKQRSDNNNQAMSSFANRCMNETQLIF